MPTVRSIEARIWRIEGFKVRMLHLTGADIRGDKMGVPSYPYTRAMKNSANVRAWRDGRFHHTYPGFHVEVLDQRGHKAHGSRLLGSVRDTYLDD